MTTRAKKFLGMAAAATLFGSAGLAMASPYVYLDLLGSTDGPPTAANQATFSHTVDVSGLTAGSQVYFELFVRMANADPTGSYFNSTQVGANLGPSANLGSLPVPQGQYTWTSSPTGPGTVVDNGKPVQYGVNALSFSLLDGGGTIPADFAFGDTTLNVGTALYNNHGAPIAPTFATIPGLDNGSKGKAVGTGWTGGTGQSTGTPTQNGATPYFNMTGIRAVLPAGYFAGVSGTTPNVGHDVLVLTGSFLVQGTSGTGSVQGVLSTAATQSGIQYITSDGTLVTKTLPTQPGSVLDNNGAADPVFVWNNLTLQGTVASNNSQVEIVAPTTGAGTGTTTKTIALGTIIVGDTHQPTFAIQNNGNATSPAAVTVTANPAATGLSVLPNTVPALLNGTNQTETITLVPTTPGALNGFTLTVHNGTTTSAPEGDDTVTLTGNVVSRAGAASLVPGAVTLPFGGTVATGVMMLQGGTLANGSIAVTNSTATYDGLVKGVNASGAVAVGGSAVTVPAGGNVVTIPFTITAPAPGTVMHSGLSLQNAAADSAGPGLGSAQNTGTATSFFDVFFDVSVPTSLPVGSNNTFGPAAGSDVPANGYAGLSSKS
ncbi:MAG: hypothetical protein ACHRHE_08215, partial [Tepidisphaerales bacterium]